jgi:hypothetical protein
MRVPAGPNSLVRLMRLGAIWSACAYVFLQCIVFFEPAPCDVVFLALFGFLVGSNWLMRRHFDPVLLVFGAVFILLNLVSYFQSAGDKESLVYMAITVYLVLLAYSLKALVAIRGPGMMTVLLLLWTAAAMISSVLAIGGYYGVFPGSDTLTLYQRGKALFKDPNVYGPFLVVPLVYLWARLGHARFLSVRAFFILGCMGLLVAGMIYSFSRGAFFVAGIAGLSFLATQVIRPGAVNRKMMTYFLVAGGMGTLAAGAFIFLSDTGTADFIRYRFQSQDHDQLRFWFQRMALRESLENPFGIGPGLSDRFLSHAPHHSYLRILIENGLAALIVYLLLLLRLFWVAIKALRVTRDPLCAEYLRIGIANFIALALMGCFIDTIHWRYWFVLMGLLAGCAVLPFQKTKAVA